MEDNKTKEMAMKRDRIVTHAIFKNGGEVMLGPLVERDVCEFKKTDNLEPRCKFDDKPCYYGLTHKEVPADCPLYKGLEIRVWLKSYDIPEQEDE